MKSKLSYLLILCTGILTLSYPMSLGAADTPPAARVSGVQVSEKEIVIPTYEAGEPEPNPMFYFGRQSQGAQAPVYPYPMYDLLTGKKEDKTYKIVYLENEYLRIGILPEIGGRVFEGVDKTNGYNFIYRQHVIKPVLISILGAWISGGIEWNIPHHHRATTFEPAQYSVEVSPDGSKTVWVGELELRDRMQWAVGYTLRPGKSYLEARMRILNRTAVENSMLCFANVAVHVNDDYQVIFPPSTQFGTSHFKRGFQKWPVPDTTSTDRAPVDISWWKSHVNSTSVFAWNYEDDFMAGYDHGKNAGTMSIADHNVVPGKKFFTWGTGAGAKSWDASLTDGDGPYIELMVGAYSDNQPDYSWMQPYESRSFSMSWYPFRDIDGVKKANLDAAVNLETANGVAKMGFYATSAHTAANVVLKAGDKVLYQETVAINPAKPYRHEVTLPAGLDVHDLVASLSEGGKELVSYSPVRLKDEQMPKNTPQAAAPADLKTNEELYLTGLRAKQFHDPAVDPEPYWLEALKRDPGDARVNTALGISRFKAARYAEAEKLLRTAVERLSDRYTSPKDVEAMYYLGITLKAEGKEAEAFKILYQTAWSQAWKAPAYYTMAEIATGRGDWADALDYVDRSLGANSSNIRAINLKAAILRHQGKPQDGLKLLSTAAHEVDPLDVRSMAEQWLASKDAAAGKKLGATMVANAPTGEETAAEYLEAGLWQDGKDVLLQMTAASKPADVQPMAYYYLSYFAAKLGQDKLSAEYHTQAVAMKPDYVFPFQNEALTVLAFAIKNNPTDARAPYYLGNLLYDWQPEEATKLWAASAKLDPGFAIVHRNLATAYAHQKPADNTKAIAELEAAVAASRKYPVHFTELDELYEQAGTPVEKRLPLFEANKDVVAGRDDSQNRAIALKIAVGKYDDAIAMMTGRTFAVAEGANLNVGEHWTDAHLFRGQDRVKAGQFKEALADFQAAGTVPSNLPGGGGFGRGNSAELAYWTGMAYEGMGDHAKALESWNKIAAPAPVTGQGGRGGGGGGMGGPRMGGGGGAQSYYQALCFQKVGMNEKAKPLFDALVAPPQNAGQQGGRGGGGGFGRSQSTRARDAATHYSAGLGYLGLNDQTKAKAELKQAIELSPDLLAARKMLSSLE